MMKTFLRGLKLSDAEIESMLAWAKFSSLYFVVLTLCKAWATQRFGSLSNHPSSYFGDSYWHAALWPILLYPSSLLYFKLNSRGSPYFEEQNIPTLVEEARKKYSDKGVEPNSIDGLVFDEVIKPRSVLLLDHIWFEIVDWMTPAESGDPLEERHAADPWLQAFLPTEDVASVMSAPSQQYKMAVSRFDTDPKAFVEALNAFSQDVHLQDLCELLLEELSTDKHGRGNLMCWLEIKCGIAAIPRQEGKSTSDSKIKGNDSHLHGAMALLSDIGSGNAANKGLSDTAQAVAKYLTQIKPRDTRADSRNAQLLLRLHSVLLSQWATNNLVKNISDRLRTLRQQDADTPLSAASSSLLSNVRSFYRLVKGIPGEHLTLRSILSELHTLGAQRHHEWTPLYKEINDLKADVAKKQQVITCLGFRHVLETLPDQAELVQCFSNWQPNGATGYWKMAWKFAVERELVLMLFECLQKLIAAGAVPIAPRASRLAKSGNLRKLFTNDFEFWFKNQRGKREMLANNNPNDIDRAYAKFEQAQATAKATTPARPPGNILHAPAGTPAKTTQHTALFTNLKLSYDEWNSYMRGAGLYSELSSSIHQYNKQFEVDETNWDRSDFLMLQWLQPDVKPNGEVDWTQARVQMDLPFTP